jgi:hypothetical protein
VVARVSRSSATAARRALAKGVAAAAADQAWGFFFRALGRGRLGPPGNELLDRLGRHGVRDCRGEDLGREAEKRQPR